MQRLRAQCSAPVPYLFSPILRCCSSPQFSEALLVIPKTLAVNAAQDATDLVAKLCAMHHRSQTVEEKAEERFTGLDLIEGKVRDNRAAGVLEPALSKVKSLRFATEAAITILRIDDMIKINEREDPAAGGGHH